MSTPIIDTTRFDDDKRIFSEQRIRIPRDRLKPDVALDTTLVYRLAALYFATVEHAVGPMFNVDVTQDGIDIILRGRGVALRFGVGDPHVGETNAMICWSIIGGWALNRAAGGGGTFSIGAEWDTARENLDLFTRVEDYPSSIAGQAQPLRRMLYALTQKPAHTFFTHRFLAEAERELTKT
jgi:hypothetical protein